MLLNTALRHGARAGIRPTLLSRTGITATRLAPFRSLSSSSIVVSPALRFTSARATAAISATAAAVLMASVFAVCESDESGKQKDELSGLSFPRHLAAPSSSFSHNALELLGTGTRSVTFLGYYVYAVGLYVVPEAKSHLKSAALAAADFEVEKAKKEGLPVELLTALGESRRALLIKPYRAAALSHLRDGFGRALDQRAKAVAGNDVQKRKQLSEDITAFKQVREVERSGGGGGVAPSKERTTTRADVDEDVPSVLLISRVTQWGVHRDLITLTFHIPTNSTAFSQIAAQTGGYNDRVAHSGWR